jgi:hypothetical protein
VTQASVLAGASVTEGTSGTSAASTSGTPAVAASASGSGWTAFLAAAQAKVSLRMSLLDSRPIEESAERLHIGLATELAERALRSEMTVLTELAARAYGGPRRVELSVVRPASSAAPVTAAARTRELTDRARSSPTVKSAVEILGGEITDVRPRSRGGEP